MNSHTIDRTEQLQRALAEARWDSESADIAVMAIKKELRRREAAATFARDRVANLERALNEQTT